MESRGSERGTWMIVSLMSAGVAMVAWTLVGCSGSESAGMADAAAVAVTDAASSGDDALDATPRNSTTDAEGPGIEPSGGSGGAFPGLQLRDDYVLYVPESYDPDSPAPLISVFHGQGDSAQNIVEYWSSAADSGGFVVLAIDSTGSSGGWSLRNDPNRWLAALADAEAAYNIELARHYLWGFSAGGHVAHWLILQGENADEFAAYAVNAGVLAAAAGADAPREASRQIPLQLRIGTSDRLLDQARSDRGRFVAAGWIEGESLDYVEFDGGHVIPASHPEEIWAFFATKLRP